MQDRQLQRGEVVVERQERLVPEGEKDFVLTSGHRGFRLLRLGWRIGSGCLPLPLRHRRPVDAVALRQGSRALLAMLHRSTDRLDPPGRARGQASVALPCRTSPTAHPSMPAIRSHHRSLGPNTRPYPQQGFPAEAPTQHALEAALRSSSQRSRGLQLAGRADSATLICPAKTSGNAAR